MSRPERKIYNILIKYGKFSKKGKQSDPNYGENYQKPDISHNKFEALKINTL